MADEVQVSCIIDPSFNLTQKVHEKYVCFAAASSNDRYQVWHRKYDASKKDAKDRKAFALTNARSGVAMKYNGIDKDVLLVPYAKGDDSQLWISGSSDVEPSGTLMPFTANDQCLTAVLNSSCCIDEDTEVKVSSNDDADNQVWMVAGKK